MCRCDFCWTMHDKNYVCKENPEYKKKCIDMPVEFDCSGCDDPNITPNDICPKA